MKSQKSSPAAIIKQIQNLLEELSDSLAIKPQLITSRGKERTIPDSAKKYSGPSGGVAMLYEQGYFDEPRALPEVISRLRQEGFNYSRQTVSMALLRTVRRRDLVRLPAEGRKGKEQWVYATRK